MIKCVNSNSLQRATSFDELLRQATHAGFAGLELDFGADQPIFLERFGETGSSALKKVKDWGLKICSVATGKYDIFSLGAPDAQVREAANEYYKNLIDLAAEFGRGVVVVIAAHEIRPLGTKLEGSYEQTFNFVFESLEAMAGRAERQSIYLAIETPGGGLLLSPLELRELIDQINNPYVGICLNPHYVERLGDPLDWLSILDRRVIMIHLPVERLSFDEADKNYQPLLHTLKARGFTGPLVYINWK